ncbi:MAG: phosphodiester glycosidase family protein [Myxacorys chilensis ATA2-1-KO14]|jgi:hypothetical protein|nr:phosphodiester glycosidase family protein [Myxacorys chilensis ATA2-1-KO14]
MKLHFPGHLKPIFGILVGGLLSIPILLYVLAQFSRPPRTDETRLLFPNVTYTRDAIALPRPVMIHVVRLDLSAQNLKAFTTPGVRAERNGAEVKARTVSEFLREFRVQVAINANFFYPFREESPWDFYPRSGDLANNTGQVASNGATYSLPQYDWSTLCFSAQNRAQIDELGVCPAGTAQAIAGNDVLVKQGKPVSLPPDVAKEDKPYPRTAIAIDKTGKKVWLVVVDGKQFRYSEGLTIAELTDYIVTELGADAALNLDGGGSVTLAVETPTGAQVLNAPIQTRLPLRERPVASHLGFYVGR